MFPDGTPVPRHTSGPIKFRPTPRERILSIVRKLKGADHTIYMYPDYGASLPLWPGSPKAPDPEDLLPQDLLGRLNVWQEYWESHHDYRSGWDTKEAETRWKADGAALARQVREALPTGLKLQVDF
jgi:hypothetical protein